jgi:hypothetical protein
MVIATLASLLALDYPVSGIVMVDNNTHRHRPVARGGGFLGPAPRQGQVPPLQD